MPISLECDHCGKKLKAADRLAGRRIKCPGCETVLEVVAPIEATSDEDFLNESPSPSASEPDSDNPFAGDLLTSDDMEDPRARRQRIAERQAQREAERAAREAEEEAAKQPRKKSKPPAKAERTDADLGQPFRFHWIYLIALIPLSLSVLWHRDTLAERLARTMESNREIEAQLDEATSLTDFLMILPNHRIEGALLGRDTLLHWGFGLVSAAGYLGLLFAMFPGTHKRTTRLLLVGLFTGTIGVLLLLAFQTIAAGTQSGIVRGRGLGVLIFLIFQLIGWSYRCAADPSIGFWGSFFGFTIGVGLCEELCKSLPIRHYLRTARKTGWRGACLTGLASGIGFGVSEGIMYSGNMYNGMSDGFTYIIRFVSCVSLHAMWSGSVALMMYRNQDFLDADELLEIVLGMLYYISIAMVLHGLYDTLLKHDLDGVALLIGLGSYCWLFYLVRESRGT